MQLKICEKLSSKAAALRNATLMQPSKDQVVKALRNSRETEIREIIKERIIATWSAGVPRVIIAETEVGGELSSKIKLSSPTHFLTYLKNFCLHINDETMMRSY